ncbi:MAG: DNA recombination protein RmuC [Bdellovibrionaceae bacterium]|nr:DNA recombination protein RmuC [Pseudobdellovibrionaceae bacterium]
MSLFESVAIALLVLLAGTTLFFFYLWRKTLTDNMRNIELALKDSELKNQIHLQDIQSQLKVSNNENKELRHHNSELKTELTQLNQKIISLAESRSKLESEIEQTKKHFSEQLSFVESAKEKLLENFKSLSLDSLNQNNHSFLNLAKSSFDTLNQTNLKELDHRRTEIKQTVSPIYDTLNKFENKLNELEKNRVESFTNLFSHFNFLKESQDKLRSETSNLVKALRTPHVRGRWGELQLKRVVEIAGMLEHCDFVQQESIDTEEGRLRPDMTVRLPGKKSIIVDSKAVLHAYLEAAQTEDETLKKELLLQHAGHIRTRITELSRKSYWEQFEESPEFVVLFLPGESFFSSALEVSPLLIEEGVSEKVILATPTTLIALLKAVSYGWKQAALTENATHISQLGKELYKRLIDMRGHFEKLGNQLSSSVDSYNKTLASYETRVLVSARRFKELKSIDGNDDMEIIEPIEKTTRTLSLEPPKE